MNGSELRTLRRTAGLTQKQMAESLDVSTRTLKNWEYGVTSPGEPYKSALTELDLLRERNSAAAVSSAVRKSNSLLELANLAFSHA